MKGNQTMGYVMCHSACAGYKQLFAYNPNRVPSVRINGHREPICRNCVERANPTRINNGLDPIVPLPGAYEPVAEQDVDWNDHD